ncbi:stress-response A/B barrel domain-containing protein UP3 [Neltuma alba]|uniref:stress-response A/B barrel domain-containing protein UP3 n=1 Tax=Neltuma alba TaxID=207710 RepID=UPI0010A33E65|nr:stress-response A/B barrel domain-containing protein UP3-like [Prosopis alba]
MSTQIIEHVVLFKVKDETEPSNVTAMVDRINSLVSLPQVLHIAMGPLHRLRSSSLTFTHMLHARYNSRADLDAYTTHPAHVSVVKANAPFCDDTMALDWVAHDLRGDLVLPPGSAVRVRFLKLKENSSDEVKNEILGVLREIEDKFSEISQFSCGENFSPGRAKGFSIGWVAVFGGIRELEAVDSNEEWGKYEKDKIGEYVEREMVMDQVVASREA